MLFKGGAGSAVDGVIPSLLAGLDGPDPARALEVSVLATSVRVFQCFSSACCTICTNGGHHASSSTLC